MLSNDVTNVTIFYSDDWADKASENGSSADDAGGGGGGSGDDGSESMDTDSGEAEAASIAKKQARAADAIKKTHLNIVFIGHVGEWNRLAVVYCTW